MKNILLSAVAVAALSLNANAQRMTLHEEFTGENCPPCASTNPDFWALCNGATNPSKLIHISYMVPIPSAGFYCNRTSAIFTNRDAYYSVPFAPYGRYDGHVPNPTASSPGHPGYFTQADIDAEAARPDSFTITATSAWNATFTQIITTVNVTCVTAWTSGGSSPVYLRTALIQTNDFATSPGTNGETHFENVVQAMYPDAVGTSMPGTWTAGMTQTFTITGTVPTWVDKSNSPYMVVWMQDDNNKSITQAAKGNFLPSIAVDAASTATTGPADFVCATGTYSAAHSVTLKNTGTTTLTAADIYYKADAGAYTSFAWTGSLAAGATASVAMPAVSVTVAGPRYHSIIDSVANPNGSTDVNLANNVTGTSFFIENTAGAPLPYSTSFEGAVTDTNFYATDGANNGFTWGVYYNNTTPLGHTGAHAAGYELGFFPAGTINTIVLPEVNIPTPAQTAISYWVAYSQFTTANTDLLEVVYSTDCGASWISLSSATPTATLAASSSTLQVPNAASQYQKYQTSLGSVPAGNVMLGFRGTRNGGNSIWVDDINIHSTVGVAEINAATLGATVYPNPAKDEATLTFTLGGQSEVNIQLVDGLGRVVATIANEKMEIGMHAVSINTANLASGVYNAMIHTEAGTFTQRFSVAK